VFLLSANSLCALSLKTREELLDWLLGFDWTATCSLDESTNLDKSVIQGGHVRQAGVILGLQSLLVRHLQFRETWELVRAGLVLVRHRELF
jgi:hypothetical protein